MRKQKSGIVGDMMRGTQIVKKLSDALRDRGGNDAHLLKILDQNSPFPVLIADLLMQTGEMAAPPSPPPPPATATATDSLVPEGWRIERYVLRNRFEVRDLEFIPFLYGGELFLRGEDIMERLAQLRADHLGLADAKYVLDHQDQIPADLREYTLFFAGAILCDDSKEYRVPYLVFLNNAWTIEFYWLKDEWGGNFRAARLKPL